VLVLRRGCHFCQESLPFYRSLAELERNKSLAAHLLAVFSDQLSSGTGRPARDALDVQSIFGVDPGALGAPGTPTLILVDGRGKVLKSWIGRLDGAAEAAVKEQLAVKATDGSG